MEFHWPVGTESERVEFGKLPGRWNAATVYGQRYDATGRWAIHTGLDLNLNYDEAGKLHFDLDAHSPVYAAESGTVEFAGKLRVWGNVIVVKHIDEALSLKLWTRYAHVEKMRISAGMVVQRGQQLAQVGNADGRYPYHLHYDVARIDLYKRPGDWPGDNLALVHQNYIDPLAWMRDQHQLAQADGGVKTVLRVTAQPTLRVRVGPSATATIIGRLGYGALVEPIEIRDGWARIEKPIKGWIALIWTQPAPSQ